MSVPEEHRSLIGRWCKERVPQHARERVRIDYQVHGNVVTIVERHPPAFPELSPEWTTSPIAQLRWQQSDGGNWVLYSRRSNGRWVRYERAHAAATPEPLLTEIEADPESIFWG